MRPAVVSLFDGEYSPAFLAAMLNRWTQGARREDAFATYMAADFPVRIPCRP